MTKISSAVKLIYQFILVAQLDEKKRDCIKQYNTQKFNICTTLIVSKLPSIVVLCDHLTSVKIDKHKSLKTRKVSTSVILRALVLEKLLLNSSTKLAFLRNRKPTRTERPWILIDYNGFPRQK